MYSTFLKGQLFFHGHFHTVYLSSAVHLSPVVFEILS